MLSWLVNELVMVAMWAVVGFVFFFFFFDVKITRRRK
jgi:hypothetical protein